ncbi:MAG: hypothetical protein UHH95_02880, partial [Oscillospiraceae bacterium]|nr:hypothetical protein [Oscillospiraceae bacterium]
TGEVSTLSANGTGLAIKGGQDGYVLVPLNKFGTGTEVTPETLQDSFGSGNYKACTLGIRLLRPDDNNPSFDDGSPLYYGGALFVEDATKFVQYHCLHKNWIPGTAVDPTCQDKGYTPYTCDDCGKVRNGDIQPAVSCNKDIPIPAQEASCTVPGFDSGAKCSWCGEITDMVNPTSLKDHNKDVYCPEVPSTCKVKGTKEGYRCSMCMQPMEGCEEIPLRKHDSIEKSEKIVVDEIPATCQGSGTSAGYKCPWCQEVLEGCETIPVADCNKVIEVLEDPATCQKEGVSKGYKCSWCGELQEGCTPLDKIDHDKKINVPKVPTSCKASGTTEGKKCSMCGELQEGCTEIAKLEHNFSQIGTVAPTIDEEGYDLYKCADCNYEEPRNFVNKLSEGDDADDDNQQDNNNDQNEGQVGDGEEGEGNIDDGQGNSGSESSGGKTPITGEEVVFLIVMIALCIGAAVVLFITKKRAKK